MLNEGIGWMIILLSRCGRFEMVGGWKRTKGEPIKRRKESIKNTNTKLSKAREML